MEAILEELGLSTLLQTFNDEKVDPRVVLSMSESALIRLGVATMGDRIRLKQLCKEDVDCVGDSNGADSVNRGSSASSTSAAEQVREERWLLFRPYNQSGAHRGRSASAGRTDPKKKGSSKRTWTGQFVCLADRHASRAPSSGEKQVLQQAGLGLKKIRFFVDDNEVEVKEKLTSDILDDNGEPVGFPQLKEAKGFEILSCSSNSRDLTVVKTAWAVKDLKSIFTSQTKIYLRPIQKSLRTKSSQQKSLVCKLKETCMWCQREFPVNELRAHLLSCSCNLFDDDPAEDIAESPPSFDVGVVHARNHSRSSHTVTANSNLPTSHLTLSGVAPFPTPEATSQGTPTPPTVSPASTQVPESGTASQDATNTATGTGTADYQVPSPAASVTIPLQAGADLESSQLSSVPSSFNTPAQSEFVFSGTLAPSEVASLNTPVQYEVASVPLGIHLVSGIAPLDISGQSGVATLGIPVLPEPEPSVPEPKVELDTVILEIVEHCKTTDIGNNPVEILRHMQNRLVLGRALDIVDPTQCSKGHTSYILVDRNNILETAFEEIEAIPNKFLTLEVQFYNEVAEDYGGPRKEFFGICLKAIKEKYFDDGFLDHKEEVYHTIGLIMGLSMLQNGAMPRFLGEHNLQEIFFNPEPTQCMLQLRNGLAELGIYQIAKEFPVFLHLLRPNPASILTFKKLTELLKPGFSEEGSNRRHFEDAVYTMFIKYLRRAAGGQRGNVSLPHILKFATGAEEEPVLGFSYHPFITFVEDGKSFLPTANTCINCLKLVRPTLSKPLPSEDALFQCFDYAFANAYFGNL